MCFCGEIATFQKNGTVTLDLMALDGDWPVKRLILWNSL
jgi:hypothetical protein